MAKPSALYLPTCPPTNRNHIFTKLLVSILLLLVGLSFRLFSDTSPPALSNTGGVSSAGVQTPISQSEKCDLFVGEWIPNPKEPVYTYETCALVDDHLNCIKNGRPDSGFLHWRWKPRGCDLPPFDAKKFLDSMRNKSLALVGDSISRNHVRSLACTLSKEEAPVEFYHDKEYKSRKWWFPSYNFTLAVIWSPLLLKADIFEDMNGVSTSELQVHLDTLDQKWVDEHRNFDYIITSGGQWFLKFATYWENGTVFGCHYCPGRNLTQLEPHDVYRKALKLTFNLYVTSGFKGTVFFRTSTPEHFENGEWSSGGTCKRSVPFRQGDVEMKPFNRVMRGIELEEFAAAANAVSESRPRLKLLDTTLLSLLRPDGHPGPYRQFQPFAENKNAKVKNDCLHWCLPGPIDSWNDIIMKMVLEE